MSERFFQAEIRAPDAATAERWLAEAFAAGAAGCEERAAEGPGRAFILYLSDPARPGVAAALRDAGAPPLEAVPVPERDWSQAWREGLVAIEISARLVVRPPSVPGPDAPGQACVVIEPGQAFGTGGHESTRLALELVDAWLARLPPGARVLDVGAGSGVLAIAAARLGAAGALGCDLDPLSAEAARTNARENGVADRVQFFTGGIAALAPGCFELVVANLLWREVEPELPEIARRVADGGVALFAGLLASDGPRIETALGASGLSIVETREHADADGERWLGVAARR